MPCHFAFPIFIFQLPFSTIHLHFPHYNFHFPLSNLEADSVAFTGWVPVDNVYSYGVRGIYGPGGQPTMHSVLIIRHLRSGSCPTDRAFFNFPISYLERTLRHLQVGWLTDHAHCKCLIIRTLRMVGQPPSL